MTEIHSSNKSNSGLLGVITQSITCKPLVPLTGVKFSWSTRFLATFTIEMIGNKTGFLLKYTGLSRKSINKSVF